MAADAVAGEMVPVEFAILGPLEVCRSGGVVPLGGPRQRGALDLWRGGVLADLADYAFTRPEAARLEELRLAALEALLFSAFLSFLQSTLNHPSATWSQSQPNPAAFGSRLGINCPSAKG